VTLTLRVPHELRDRLHIDPGRDEATAERVPEVVPPDGPHLRRLEPGAEQVGHVVVVQRGADFAGEDEPQIHPALTEFIRSSRWPLQPQLAHHWPAEPLDLLSEVAVVEEARVEKAEAL